MGAILVNDFDLEKVCGRNTWWFDLGLILIWAASLRLLLFTGFALGDDLAYASWVHQVLQDGYPEIGPMSTFLVRPIWILGLAGSVKILGWSDVAFVLPVLISSLLGVCSVYIAGRVLGDRFTGVVASLILSVFPLDVVHSTTLTNDIVGSAFIGCSIACLAGAFSARLRPRLTITLGFAGGFLVGAAMGVKLNFGLWAGPLFLTCVLFAFLRKRIDLPVAIPILGWTSAVLSLAAFFVLFSDAGPLAPLQVELLFNNTYLNMTPSSEQLMDILLFYPRLMSGFGAGPYPDWRPSEYGCFFVIFGISFLAALLLDVRRATILGFYTLCIMCAMEFWPLQVTPQYVPIHRLSRFLHFAAIPGSITIGLTASMYAKKTKIVQFFVVALLSAYSVISLNQAYRLAHFYRDAMSDLAIAWDYASRFSGEVYSDEGLLQYLAIRSRFANTDKYRTIDIQTEFPAGSMVILGGARWPDLNPSLAAYGSSIATMEGLARVGIVQSCIRPWRPEEMRVFISLPASDLQAPESLPSGRTRITTADSELAKLRSVTGRKAEQER